MLRGAKKTGRILPSRRTIGDRRVPIVQVQLRCTTSGLQAWLAVNESGSNFLHISLGCNSAHEMDTSGSTSLVC